MHAGHSAWGASCSGYAMAARSPTRNRRPLSPVDIPRARRIVRPDRVRERRPSARRSVPSRHRAARLGYGRPGLHFRLDGIEVQQAERPGERGPDRFTHVTDAVVFLAEPMTQEGATLIGARPRTRAAAKPALVRSRSRLRSISAKTAPICSIAFPMTEDGSMPS